MKESRYSLIFVMNTGYVPSEMKHSIFIKIPKKANAIDCTDYRTLCLMSNITKIILRIITERNRRIFEREAGKMQSGFKQGMGTREGIFNLRIIAEKMLEKHKKKSICATYTIKKRLIGLFTLCSWKY